MQVCACVGIFSLLFFSMFWVAVGGRLFCRVSDFRLLLVCLKKAGVGGWGGGGWRDNRRAVVVTYEFSCFYFSLLLENLTN